MCLSHFGWDTWLCRTHPLPLFKTQTLGRPAILLLPHPHTQGSGLGVCLQPPGGSSSSSAAATAAAAQSCQLPTFLSFSAAAIPVGSPTSQLSCPALLLGSFSATTAGLPPSLVDTITSPFPPSTPPGAVIGGPGATLYYGCSCGSGASLVVSGNITVSCVSNPSAGGGGTQDSKYILAIVLVAVLPMAVIALGTFVFIK